MFGRTRFPGAGGSAEQQFARLRAENMADDWQIWMGAGGLSLGFVIWSQFASPNGARVLDLAAGFLIGVFFVFWALGGHISAVAWRLGAFGEQDTAKEIEKLGAEWHCEHDFVHDYGNWDHILVGPPGVFLLDSKRLSGQAVAVGDSLRSGRVRYSGLAARRAALEVKRRMDDALGQSAGWVQAVVVVWGDFPQALHEEERVVYVAGRELRSWLSSLEPRTNTSQIAARATALGCIREQLAMRSQTRHNAETVT